MPLILGTNSIKDTGFEVANSCRFNSGSSDHLNRSTSSGDRLKCTWSAWLKKTKNGADEDLFSGYDNSSNFTRIQIGDTGRFNYINKTSGSQNAKIETNRVFRDNSAWYHFVIVWDTGNATAGNRMRIYVNGVEETSFANETQPSLNQVSHVNQASKTNYVGTFDGSGTFFNGYMAEVVLVDGQALDPTSFGEFDSDSPTIWKPKDVSGLTFGTNGFYLDFEDSSALGNDVSGNNNDFTVNNLTSVDQSTDTCTNNFATFDPNNRNSSMGSFHHGNLEYEVDASFFRTAFATFGASQNKWYFECKRVIGTSFSIGIISLDYKNRTSNVSYIGGAGDATNNIGYLKDGNISIGGSESSGYASYGNGDTVMVAMDLDNGKVYFGVNGTWGNSGDPTSGSTGTGAVSFTPSGETWTFAVSVFDSHWEANFGSPMYSITSGNSDGEGIGNFEFAVPSGYFSMCSKNLAEYG